MTTEQIELYEYCNEYLTWLESQTLPFSGQKFGPSSRSPQIVHRLERMHGDMYSEIISALEKNRKAVKALIIQI